MLFNVFTVRKRSLWRLCFYTCLSAILFTGGYASVHAWIPPGTRQPPPPRADTLQDQARPPGSRPPRADTPLGDGYCCGRYASYWNAFLLTHLVSQPEIKWKKKLISFGVWKVLSSIISILKKKSENTKLNVN